MQSALAAKLTVCSSLATCYGEIKLNVCSSLAACYGESSLSAPHWLHAMVKAHCLLLTELRIPLLSAECSIALY